MTESSFHSAVRKRRLGIGQESGLIDGAMDLAALATLAYSSEDPRHPIDHVIDNPVGPGSPKWRGNVPNVTDQIVIEFDEPQSFSRLVYEVEESESQRTQEVRIEASDDDGLSFRQLLVQEFTFSPDGATFEREDLRLRAKDITHLRLMIVPNKQGSGTASLTTLQLFR